MEVLFSVLYKVIHEIGMGIMKYGWADTGPKRDKEQRTDGRAEGGSVPRACGIAQFDHRYNRYQLVRFGDPVPVLKVFKPRSQPSL